MRILTAALIALLLWTGLGAAPPASACTRIGSIEIGSDCEDEDEGRGGQDGPDGSARAAERRLLHLLNAARARAGLPELVPHPDAARVATAHSATMARRGRIYHSSALHVGGTAGENVGYGPSAVSIHTAFMRSPAHRANILRSFSSVGIGVRVQGETLWVTQLFVRGSITGRQTTIGSSLRSISPLSLLGEPVRPGSPTVGAIGVAGEAGRRAGGPLSGALAMAGLAGATAAWARRRYRGKRSNA